MPKGNLGDNLGFTQEVVFESLTMPFINFF
jgi:hypothetical protein